MNRSFVLLLAWRYMRPVRREGFVSIITLFSVVGMVLGVATLILVTSLMNGVREEMARMFIGMDGHISLYAASPEVALDATADSLPPAARAGALLVSPKIEGQVMASAQNRALGAQVLAWPADSLAHKPLLKENLSSDVLTALQQGGGLVLGERLARNLGVKPGDQLSLISPQGRNTFAGFIPRIKSYPVVGTVKLGMHMYDSSLILMSFAEAQLYFSLSDKPTPYHYLELTLKEAGAATAIADEIAAQFGDNVRLYDWQRSNGSLFQALAVQRNVMVVILALIIVVAAFNIISSLIMLVQDKGQDIAIMRAMGATRGQMMAAFCLSGTLIGVFGTAVGAVLGALLAKNLEAIKRGIESLTGQEILVEQIYFLSSLPTKTDPAEVAVIIISAIVLAFLATCYPAWKAASIAPAEALRYG